MVTWGSAPPSAMTRSARLVPSFRLRHQEAAEILGLGHRRRQAGHRQAGREPPQPRQAQREQIAALGGDQRVQFVEHDAPEVAEQIGRVGAGQQQRQLLGRGEQDVGRIAALALALRGRRVAGAGLDADRQAHLADRRFEVARDVDGERLQRRDVERVQALRAPQLLAGRDHPARLGAALGKLHQGRQEARQRLAAAGRRDQQHRAAVAGARQQFKLMGTRRPAARREPARKILRQQRRGVDLFREAHVERIYLPEIAFFTKVSL